MEKGFSEVEPLTNVLWTVGFETPIGYPEPYMEITGSGDFVLAYMLSVVESGWTVTTVKYRTVL